MALAAGVLVLAAGCGKSAPTRYYTLTPMTGVQKAGFADAVSAPMGAVPNAQTPAGALASAATAGSVAKTPASANTSAAPAATAKTAEGPTAQSGPCYSLGISPVEFPVYLDRTQIVTQGPGNQMQLADFDQWVEPLHENFKRILMDNLAGSLCVKPLVLFPWPAGMRPEYQVAIQVQRFDGALGQEAVLRANWSILNPAGDVLFWKAATLREPVAGPGYAPLAAAQSALVARFGQEVAAALKTLRP